MSRQTVNHILDGEGPDKAKGGHLYGTGKEGKTEFPESWTRARIIEAIGDVFRAPTYVWDPPESSQGLSEIDGVVDGVMIQIRARKNENGLYVVDRAFPVEGPGVIRNDPKKGRIKAVARTPERWAKHKREVQHEHGQ